MVTLKLVNIENYPRRVLIFKFACSHEKEAKTEYSV